MQDIRIVPYFLEVYCGPMNSGKSKALIDRVDKLLYLEDIQICFFKPYLDTRGEKKIWSKFGGKSLDCTFIAENNPSEIFQYVTDKTQVIVIDEVQFFCMDIVMVIEELQRIGKHIIVAGLDLDFRGENFGALGEILARADEVHKLKAICMVKGCNTTATRTQRLINGNPSSYYDPIILVGGQNEGYECRCLKHHEVLNKPTLNNHS